MASASAAAEQCAPCAFVTANVGSVFEDPDPMLKIWTNEFFGVVESLRPRFLALHCQEVGGKRYKRSMAHVEEFVRTLMASREMMPFDRVRVFLDEDHASADKFTALGSFYFVHETVGAVQIWDFQAATFVPVLGKEVHSGNIDNVTTKEKSKFSPEAFPEAKWSRKGFLRTRWHFDGNVFDLVNVHLFHDASNFVAVETFPSTYGECRKRALVQLVDRFRDDPLEKAPFFMFGDFNFRLNAQGVVSKLTENTICRPVSSQNGDITRLVYAEAGNEKNVVLTLGTKEFVHRSPREVFGSNTSKWLREYDLELQPFLDRLFEYEITFPPSYPYEEDVHAGDTYMTTRCPAWCDRILLSKTALSLVYNNPEDLDNSQVRYHIVGPDVCMGDHKPVYLLFRLVRNAEPATSKQDPTLRTSASASGLVSPDSTTFTRYVHVPQPGFPVRIIRETTV